MVGGRCRAIHVSVSIAVANTANGASRQVTNPVARPLCSACPTMDADSSSAINQEQNILLVRGLEIMLRSRSISSPGSDLRRPRAIINMVIAIGLYPWELLVHTSGPSSYFRIWGFREPCRYSPPLC